MDREGTHKSCTNPQITTHRSHFKYIHRIHRVSLVWMK